ncbi:Wadjet anti-phage system protein JetD domain-containing protein [Lachnospiraceae bacterium 46-15]
MEKSLIERILEQNSGSSKGRLGELTGNKSLRDFPDNSETREEAERLEKQNLLKVDWYDGKSVMKKISYRAEDLGVFYRMAGQTPPWCVLEKYRKQLQTFLPSLKKEWIQRYCEEELAVQLEKGNIPKNLQKEHFLDCLRGLDGLAEPVYKRLFSIKYLSDSKEFEREVQRAVVTIARKYCPDVTEGMEDSAVLSQIYLEEYSQELWIKGSLRLKLEGGEQDCGGFVYGAALNSRTLKNAGILPDQKITKVITVENKANFESMKYEEGTLIIFTHGFLAPGEREFLRKLVKVLPESTRYCHTGDLDLGGVRIFHDIRTKVMPKLEPLQMDADTFRRYKELGFGGKIEKQDYWEKLRGIDEPRLQGLIDEILKERWVIEQESFLAAGEYW